MKNENSIKLLVRFKYFLFLIVLLSVFCWIDIELSAGQSDDFTVISKTARVTYHPITKIPKKVVNINVIPSILIEKKEVLTEKNVESALKSFLSKNLKYFMVEPEDLKMIYAKRRIGNWYVKFQQYHKKALVYDAVVSFIATDEGTIRTYGSSYYPIIDISTTPKIDLMKAVEIAKRTYDLKIAENLHKKEVILIIYPEKKASKIEFYLAWKFLLAPKRPDPKVEKYFIVDAQSGKIIKSYLARFPGVNVKGRVRGEIYPANPTNPPISTEALSHAYLDIGGVRIETGLNGRFNHDLPWWYIFLLGHVTHRLEGPYARVRNNTGANYLDHQNCWIFNPCNFTWTAADRDHINVFYHMNLIHDWYQNRLDYDWINAWDGTNQFHAEVNHADFNAYAGDPMEFGVNCFARSSDIIYHESTHNVLYAIFGDWIGWPNRFDESYAFDEGFSDYFSCSMTEDSTHGEGCGAPRNLDNNDQYPGKDTYNMDGHDGGEIIGGAAWDLREMLIDRMGQASGSRYADNLIFEALFYMATLPSDYFFSDPQESNLLASLYFADDDNNNLDDGVPHFHQIHNVFANHGLLQAILLNTNSYDVSTNTLGTLTGGDFYFLSGSFWANNFGQRGVIGLGDIGAVPLDQAQIPLSGYSRFGVTATVDHTYVSLAQQGEEGSYIVFRVLDISAANDEIVIEYLYRTPLLVNPFDFCWRYPDFCRDIYRCDKYPFLCETRIILLERDHLVIEFRHEMDKFVIPVDDICRYVVDCPGCGPMGLCPGYKIFFDDLPDAFGIEIFNSKGKILVKDLSDMRSKRIEFRTIKDEKYFLVITPNKSTKIESMYRIPIKVMPILK